jgi:membrane protease subunit (stomatin/prohibitin family)
MGTDNVIFLELIEWFDETGKKMVYRVPEHGSGEIKLGAQLIVRESQAAVMFYKGKALDAFGGGRHTLKTGNVPILTKVLSIPWMMKSPLRAEVYFVNMKLFPDLRWGTKNPLAFKDAELGLVRLRAFGNFNIRVLQPVLFVNTIVGTQQAFATRDIEEYLGRVIISRFNDVLGENLDTIFNLPSLYDELSVELMKRLQEDFSHLGLGLNNLYINSITPPQEVQQAIDDRSKLGALDDLDKLLKLKAATALENISTQMGGGGEGGAGGMGSTMGTTMGAGMGMGMGFMMPAMFADLMKGEKGEKGETSTPAREKHSCPDCGKSISKKAKFCPSCGHQILVFQQCSECGKNLQPNARFCSRCGTSAEQKPGVRKCGKCGGENLKGAVFCNQCGEKL